MSTALQVALFLASITVVAVGVFLIPFLLQARKSLDETTRQISELKADVKLLVQDTRSLVQNVNHLTTRANQQMDEVQQVVGAVRGWSDRANRIVSEIAGVVEPPVLTFARNLNVFRKGLSVFLDVFFHRNNHPEQKDEASHVRE